MTGRAVVLLSGGLDSATALFWAHKIKKWDCHCLAFNYGQKHTKEIRAARQLARGLRAPFHIIGFRLPWGGSSLTDRQKSIPRHALAAIGHGPIPSTYVPGRNTIFLAFAVSWADAFNIDNIVIGANALDYSGYPDCRPAFLSAMNRVALTGTRLGAEQRRPIRIWAPLLRWSKKEIVQHGLRWGVPYGKTWSCYDGGRRPCRRCDACLLREKGFKEAGVRDPLLAAGLR